MSARNLTRPNRGAYSWAEPDQAARWEDYDHHDKLRSDASYVRSAMVAKRMGGRRSFTAVAPVFRRMAEGNAAMLWAGGATITPGVPEDADHLSLTVRENNLLGKSKASAEDLSALGDVFLRVAARTATPRGRKVVLLDYFDPRQVIAEHENGDELIRGSIVTVYPVRGSRGDVWRHFEVHEPGVVRHQLWHGTNNDQGSQKKLKALDKTEMLTPEVRLGAGRGSLLDDEVSLFHLTSRTQVGTAYGRSDFDQLEDLVYLFCEALSTGSQELRATVTRLFAAGELLDQNGHLRHDSSVYRLLAGTGQTLGPDALLQLKQGTFNGEKYSAYQMHLLQLALMHGNTPPQAFGLSVDGGTTTAAAERLKLGSYHADLRTRGEGYENTLSRALRVGQLLDSRSWAGKPARTWADPDAAPTVKLHEGLQLTDVENADVTVKLATADAITARQKVRRNFSHLTELQIDDVLAEKEEERAAEGERLAGVVGSALSSAPPSFDTLLS